VARGVAASASDGTLLIQAFSLICTYYRREPEIAYIALRRAAVATAAYGVLTDIVGTVPSSITFDRAGIQASLDSAYSDALADIPDHRPERLGIAAGEAAADAMIAARQGDGRFGPSPWRPNSDVGHWQPLLDPNTGAQLLDPTPWVADVRPFLVPTSSYFRTEGPLDLESREYATDYNEVKTLGASNSTVRTLLQTHIAQFWQSNVPPTWNEVTRSLVESRHLGLRESARLLAIQNLTAADAAINCWNDKYHYDFWRPWNAIPRAAEDENDATEPDPNWKPLISAPYPEHPSGHMCLDGAHLGVLAWFFGTDAISFSVLSIPFPGERRVFSRFSDALAEITDARVWAGLHFRTADLQGQQLGKNAAEYVTSNFFRPVGVR
jgi:hypothetical protein